MELFRDHLAASALKPGRSGRIKLHSAWRISSAAITISPIKEGQTLGLYKGRFCYRHSVHLVCSYGIYTLLDLT